jgi:hypothetical protein
VVTAHVNGHSWTEGSCAATDRIKIICNRRCPFAPDGIPVLWLNIASQLPVEDSNIGADQFCTLPTLDFQEQCLASLILFQDLPFAAVRLLGA